MSTTHLRPGAEPERDGPAVPSTATATATRVVLLGDVHQYRLAVAPWRLLGKRLLGQANLWLNRRHRFDRRLLIPAVRRIAQLRPDWLLLSGDLSTTALADEFADVAAALRPLAGCPRVAVPGNHDRYTRAALRRRTAERALPGLYPDVFPHLRSLADGWALVALDAAVPRLLSSRGRIGRDQLDRAAALEVPAGVGLVVLCHYPFAVPPGVRWRQEHRLADAGPLADLVAAWAGRHPQVLYLHGHVHRPWHWRPMVGGAPNVWAVNAGAPCHVGTDHPAGQGFWQLDLPRDPAEPVAAARHVPGPDGGWTVSAVDC